MCTRRVFICIMQNAKFFAYTRLTRNRVPIAVRHCHRRRQTLASEWRNKLCTNPWKKPVRAPLAESGNNLSINIALFTTNGTRRTKRAIFFFLQIINSNNKREHASESEKRAIYDWEAHKIYSLKSCTFAGRWGNNNKNLMSRQHSRCRCGVHSRSLREQRNARTI